VEKKEKYNIPTSGVCTGEIWGIKWIVLHAEILRCQDFKSTVATYNVKPDKFLKLRKHLGTAVKEGKPAFVLYVPYGRDNTGIYMYMYIKLQKITKARYLCKRINWIAVQFYRSGTAIKVKDPVLLQYV
jgi:hypothetical protein